jgi:hypothetical protein
VYDAGERVVVHPRRMRSTESELARLEVLVRYATAIDTGEHALLDEVFVPDARLDFRGAGGIEGTYSDVKAWLGEAMRRFAILQHFVSNVREVDETGLVTVCYVRAVHGYRDEGKMKFFELGGEYHDRWRDTDGGPRIVERALSVRYFQGEVVPASTSPRR